MNQSKAKPTRPRPVEIDRILIDWVAVQPASQLVVKVFSWPDHWPSISPPKTNIPACQLKPIWPPAMAPLGLPEPMIRVPLSSVGPPTAMMLPPGPKAGTGLVKPEAPRPVNVMFDEYCPQPYPALAPK